MGTYNLKYLERKLIDVDTLAERAGTSKEAAEKLLRQMKREEEAAQVKVQPPEGGITMREAERKYNVSHSTISRWVAHGYIPVLSMTKKYVYMDERRLKEVIAWYRENPGQGKYTVKKVVATFLSA